PGKSSLTPNRKTHCSTTATTPGHTRSSFWGPCSTVWVEVMRDYTVPHAKLFRCCLDLKIRVSKTDSSQIPRVEGVALADVAGVVAAFEPAQALFGGAVGEGVGDDVAGRLALDFVVADRAGGG